MSRQGRSEPKDQRLFATTGDKGDFVREARRRCWNLAQQSSRNAHRDANEFPSNKFPPVSAIDSTDSSVYVTRITSDLAMIRAESASDAPPRNRTSRREIGRIIGKAEREITRSKAYSIYRGLSDAQSALVLARSDVHHQSQRFLRDYRLAIIIDISFCHFSANAIADDSVNHIGDDYARVASRQINSQLKHRLRKYSSREGASNPPTGTPT